MLTYIRTAFYSVDVSDGVSSVLSYIVPLVSVCKMARKCDVSLLEECTKGSVHCSKVLVSNRLIKWKTEGGSNLPLTDCRSGPEPTDNADNMYRNFKNKEIRWTRYLIKTQFYSRQTKEPFRSLLNELKLKRVSGILNKILPLLGHLSALNKKRSTNIDSVRTAQ